MALRGDEMIQEQRTYICRRRNLCLLLDTITSITSIRPSPDGNIACVNECILVYKPFSNIDLILNLRLAKFIINFVQQIITTIS